MSTTITSDNILSPKDGYTTASKQRGDEQQPTSRIETESATPKTTQSATSSVDVARASQIYSQSRVESSSEGGITTPQQAAAVAKEISQQFDANAEQAIRSQGRQASASLAALLEAAPA